MAGRNLPTSSTRLASPRSSLVLWGDHLAQGLIARELDCNGRGLAGGILLLFPGHTPPGSLTQWMGLTSVAAREHTHPNQYKKHKLLAAQAKPTRGGLVPCSPDSVAEEDTQTSILYLGALGVSQPFPSPARQHSKAQTCGLCLSGLRPGDQRPLLALS